MSDRAERAVEGFREGFNCAQAILAIYGAELGLDREVALKAASALGAGMGRRGEVCGAVTGALLVLGLRHGFTDARDRVAKGRTYDLAWDLSERFLAAHGALLCRDLLGCDLATVEGMAMARERGYFRERCPRFVRTAAEILETFL